MAPIATAPPMQAKGSTPTTPSCATNQPASEVPTTLPKLNVAIAIARRRIKATGDVRAALAIIPITKPLFAHYRQMIAADYPHLDV